MNKALDLRNVLGVDESDSHFHITHSTKGRYSVPKKALDGETADHIRSFAKGIAAAKVAAKNQSSKADDGVKVPDDSVDPSTVSIADLSDDDIKSIADADKPPTQGQLAAMVANRRAREAQEAADKKVAQTNSNAETETRAAAGAPLSTSGVATDTDLNQMVQGAARQGWSQNPAANPDDPRFAAPVSPPVQSGEDLAAKAQEDAFIQKATADRKAAVEKSNLDEQQREADLAASAKAAENAATLERQRKQAIMNPPPPPPVAGPGQVANFSPQPITTPPVAPKTLTPLNAIGDGVSGYLAGTGATNPPPTSIGGYPISPINPVPATPAAAPQLPSVTPDMAGGQSVQPPEPPPVSTVGPASNPEDQTSNFQNQATVTNTPGPAPATIASNGLMQPDKDLLDKWDGWQRDITAATDRTAKLTQDSMQVKADALQKSLEKQDANMALGKAAMDQYDKDSQATIDWFKDPANKLDANRIFHSMSVGNLLGQNEKTNPGSTGAAWGGMAATWIGSILGGIGAGLTHTPNGFWEVVDKGIQRDVQNQMQNREDHMNIYNISKSKALMDLDAVKLAHANELDRIAGLTQKLGDQFNSDNAKNAAVQISREALMKGTALRQSVEQNNLIIRNYPSVAELARKNSEADLQLKQAQVQNLLRQQVIQLSNQNQLNGRDPYDNIPDSLLIGAGMKPPVSAPTPAQGQPQAQNTPQAPVLSAMGAQPRGSDAWRALHVALNSDPSKWGDFQVRYPEVLENGKDTQGNQAWRTTRDSLGNPVLRQGLIDPKNEKVKDALDNWIEMDNGLDQLQKIGDKMKTAGSWYPSDKTAVEAIRRDLSGKATTSGGDKLVVGQIEKMLDETVPDPTGVFDRALTNKFQAGMDVAKQNHYATLHKLLQHVTER